MKINITYYDDDSLTKEEAIKRIKDIHGEYVDIDISPTSSDPLDLIYFGIQQLITQEQLSILYDETHLYKQKLEELKHRIFSIIQKEISRVIKDNEIKVS